MQKQSMPHKFKRQVHTSGNHPGLMYELSLWPPFCDTGCNSSWSDCSACSLLSCPNLVSYEHTSLDPSSTFISNYLFTTTWHFICFCNHEICSLWPNIYLRSTMTTTTSARNIIHKNSGRNETQYPPKLQKRNKTVGSGNMWVSRVDDSYCGRVNAKGRCTQSFLRILLPPPSGYKVRGSTRLRHGVTHLNDNKVLQCHSVNYELILPSV